MIITATEAVKKCKEIQMSIMMQRLRTESIECIISLRKLTLIFSDPSSAQTASLGESLTQLTKLLTTPTSISPTCPSQPCSKVSLTTFSTLFYARGAEDAIHSFFSSHLQPLTTTHCEDYTPHATTFH